jgi:hypothetical protein
VRRCEIRDEWNEVREFADDAKDDGRLDVERGPGIDAAFKIRQSLEHGAKASGALPRHR